MYSNSLHSSILPELSEGVFYRKVRFLSLNLRLGNIPVHSCFDVWHNTKILKFAKPVV